MDSFNIQLLESSITIQPQVNGTYGIMEGSIELGLIYPESLGDQEIWNNATDSDIDFDFMQQIGELITEHNL